MADASEPAFGVIDWGTTQFRAYLADSQGTILDQVANELGVRALKREQFPAVFGAALAGWGRALAGRPVVIAGMAGSSLGWVEAPYVPCPAAPAAIAAALVPVAGAHDGPVLIVPGLCSIGADGLPDVMRGEETQVLGAAARFGDGLYGLPGTHAKWVQVEGGLIRGFTTHLTGESFGLYARMSVLARTIAGADGPFDAAAFAEGLSRQGRRLLQALFSIRARAVVSHWPGEAQRDFLSGLLIGAELAEALPAGAERAVLVGAADLVALYRLALAGRNVAAETVDGAAAVVAGAVRLARLWREGPAAR